MINSLKEIDYSYHLLIEDRENDSILFHPNVIKKYMLQGEKLCLPIK